MRQEEDGGSWLEDAGDTDIDQHAHVPLITYGPDAAAAAAADVRTSSSSKVGALSTPSTESDDARTTAWRSWMLLALAMSAALTLGVLHWHSRPALPPPPLRMRAWVLGSKPERLASTSAAIRQAFPSFDLSISSIPMIPLSDARILYRAHTDAAAPPPLNATRTPSELRALSTSLGWMDMWTRAGADSTLGEEEWMMMFEDDVALVPQPMQAGPQPFDYAPALLELFAQPAVQSDGVVYLGACNPEWAPMYPVSNRWRNLVRSRGAPTWLTSRRGVAWCSHALAFTKRRARTLSSDFASFLHTGLTYASDTNLRSLWIATKRWPFVFGAGRRSPLIDEHWGLFFQDRAHHRSIINQPTPEQGGNVNGTATATGGSNANSTKHASDTESDSTAERWKQAKERDERRLAWELHVAETIRLREAEQAAATHSAAAAAAAAAAPNPL